VSDQPTRRAGYEKFLGLFAEVKAGEGRNALILTVAVFLILCSYYIMKVAREPLILTGGVFGLEKATLAAAANVAQSFLLVGIVPIYARLADRVPRKTLLNGVFGFFTVCLVLFFGLARFGVPLGFAFFVWLGVFNLMVISLFWSFANDIYSEEQGKRLFAIIAVGATTGAIAGSFIAGRLAKVFDPSSMTTILLSAVLLVLSLVLVRVVEHSAASFGGKSGTDSLEKGGGFALVWRRRQLLMIALMIMVYNVVNTNGEWLLREFVSTNAFAEANAAVVTAGAARALEVKRAAESIIGSFYGDFYTWVNILAALAQLFIVSRVFKYFGLRVALLVMPVLAFGGYAMLALLPVLAVLRPVKIVENSTDYSLQNTTRHALFLSLTRAEKYKAKAAIDTFFVRFGDVLSFGVVFACSRWLGLSVGQFALVNVGLVTVWIVLAVVVGRGVEPGAGQGENT
jgi:AAA family ATP:ADP antiporter